MLEIRVLGFVLGVWTGQDGPQAPFKTDARSVGALVCHYYCGYYPPSVTRLLLCLRAIRIMIEVSRKNDTLRLQGPQGLRAFSALGTCTAWGPCGLPWMCESPRGRLHERMVRKLVISYYIVLYYAIYVL